MTLCSNCISTFSVESSLYFLFAKADETMDKLLILYHIKYLKNFLIHNCEYLQEVL